MAQLTCAKCGGYKVSSRGGARAEMVFIAGFFTFGTVWILGVICWLLGALLKAFGCKFTELYTCDICGYMWEE